MNYYGTAFGLSLFQYGEHTVLVKLIWFVYSEGNMAKNGIYIYGIVPNFYGAEHFRSLEYAGVYAIPLQNISAIVSDLNVDFIDFSNRKAFAHQLVHHQLTIERVMTLGFTMILPMKPETIVNSKEEVKTILVKGHDLFISSFNHIANMTEFDLTVTWADLNSPTQADQVKTGMLLREKLDERNKNIELKILNVLTSFSTNLKLHEVLNDNMISNAAFLINRNMKGKFKQTVGQLEEEFNGMLSFNLAGPLPCYSFFTMEVKELGPAAKQASHTEFTSLVNEKTIQKMYLVRMKD